VFVDVSQPFEAAVELKKFVPGAVISAELTHNWLTDERARGSWLAFTPAQLAAIRTLHHLDGPVQFTGGDLADGWAGWMEGAVTAGAHTADIISQRWVAGTL
jgi:monoamine oxidase